MHIACTRILFAVLIIAKIAGQEPGTEKSTSLKTLTRGTLEVHVKQAVTDEPIEDATIILRLGRQTVHSAQTGRTGQVTIGELGEGTYSIVAAKRHYGDIPGEQGSIQTVTFGAGRNNTQSVELQLLPPGGIHGMVMRDDGASAARIRISLFKRMIDQGRVVFMPVTFVQTDTDGKYTFAAVAPGEYRLAAIPNEARVTLLDRTLADDETRVRQQNVTTYLGATTELAASTPVYVTPGQTLLGIDVILRKADTFCLTIPISDQTRTLTHSDMVVKANRNENNHESITFIATVTPSQAPTTVGLRVCDLERGTYEITAHAVDNRTGDYLYFSKTHLLSEIARRTSEIELSHPPKLHYFELSASKDAEKLPLDGLTAELEPIGRRPFIREQLEFQLVPGRNELFALIPGSYLLRIRGTSRERFVATLDADGQDLRRSPMQTDRSHSGAIRVIVTSGQSQIKGLVKNEHGRPVERGAIVAVPAPGYSQIHPGLFYSSSVAPDGSFSFTGITPGEYSVICFLNTTQVDAIAIDAITPKWTFRQAVSVDGKQVRTMEFRSDGTSCR